MAFQERERRHATGATPSPRSLPVYFIAAVAAIGGFLFGYDTGVISGALLFLKQSFALNATTQEIAVSAVLVGAIIGAIVAGRINDALGRKKALLLLAVIFTAGALLTAISPNLVFFLVCRVIVGLGIGAAASVVSTVAQITWTQRSRRPESVQHSRRSCRMPGRYRLRCCPRGHAGWSVPPLDQR